ncbi:Nuclear factor 7, ovary [Bagarius yarrelli]|uniref:Nuclear factor 7, ovary n=1 Tax=Bagarius yarrelli TaxID=175774 RepID=A0A556VAG1_BAGYA|nr:Nuclear factor 7, ovary [Bagarius yarrelli]
MKMLSLDFFFLISVPEGVDDGDGDDEVSSISVSSVYSFPAGLAVDLTACSSKLIEKTDHILNIEKDLFEVKEKLTMTKLLCQNSSQASSVQIAVSKILEQYVKAQKLELDLSVEKDSEKIKALEILLLIQEIKNLENRIQSETSESKKNTLENELREKKQQLTSKKKESEDPGMKEVLTIISKLEELWRFQNENVDLNLLDQIQDKKQEVLALISELDDSNLAKIVLTNLVLLSDQTHLKKLIADLKQQADRQIAELQEEVRKKKEELKRKNAELQKTHGAMATLKLKAEFENTVTKLNDSLINELFTVEALKHEVQRLEDDIRLSKGNVKELTSKLKEKKAELDKAKKTIKKWKQEFLRILDLLEDLRKVTRKQEEHIKEYLAKINHLQVIFVKEELAKLNKDLARLKEEHQENIAGLEKEIDEKNKEIGYLKRSGCGTDQHQNQISSLQQELAVKQRELKQLKRQNAAQIKELKEQLTKKERKLNETTEELKELSSENAKLKCENQLNQEQREVSDLKKENAEHKDQLKQKKKEISSLINNNEDFRNQLKQKEKELSDLQNNNRDVIQENERLRQRLGTMNMRVTAIENLENQLKQEEKKNLDLKEKNADLNNENKLLHGDVRKLNSQLKALEKLINEKENLQKNVNKLEDRIKKLEKQPVTLKPPTVNIESLQFDPNTAHRRLLIFNERSARGVQYSIDRPADPRRYDKVIGTVTKTGFTTGRPYWEVQVKDRSCFTVGVAAEFAAKKGDIWYRPNKNYWVIQKRNKQHYLLTEPPLLLHLTSKLNIIGVLIDFRKGQVAFYNVETKTLLGIFTGNNFTQKLYPFVATCGTEGPEDWPIELLETSFPTWLPN